MKILLVEDDLAVQRLVKEVLSRAGYTVEIAPNGSDAIECVTHKTYDAIVLDLMMPILSGFEVIDWLREHDRAMLRRVVVATAVASRDLKRFKSGEVSAILRKPFDINELLKAVRACLDQNS